MWSAKVGLQILLGTKREESSESSRGLQLPTSETFFVPAGSQVEAENLQEDERDKSRGKL
jgi:hypothetical protein